MKILYIPDIHEEMELLNRILDKHAASADKVVFLGDYFDSFNGITPNTTKTCEWLGDSINNPNYTFLLGNHDVQYMNRCKELRCSGYEEARKTIIDGHKLPWGKFKLSHEVVDDTGKIWLASHAGIHSMGLLGEQSSALSFLFTNSDPAVEPPRILQAGECRGGWAETGGIIWLDWRHEFKPISGLNQIVGHTKGREVRGYHTAKSMNFCIDTGLRHSVMLDTEIGELKILYTHDINCTPPQKFFEAH